MISLDYYFEIFQEHNKGVSFEQLAKEFDIPTKTVEETYYVSEAAFRRKRLNDLYMHIAYTVMSYRQGPWKALTTSIYNTLCRNGIRDLVQLTYKFPNNINTMYSIGDVGKRVLIKLVENIKAGNGTRSIELLCIPSDLEHAVCSLASVPYEQFKESKVNFQLSPNSYYRLQLANRCMRSDASERIDVCMRKYMELYPGANKWDVFARICHSLPTDASYLEYVRKIIMEVYPCDT